MAEPFKNLINAELVTRTGAVLARNSPAFDRARFERLALHELESLEMKARAMRIADALEATLPQRFDDAAALIEASLAPADERDGDGVASQAVSEAGLAGWIVWPLGEFVARRGLAHPQRALACLRELTMRLTAEFAIRPFIVEHPAITFATLARWVHDPSAHVRRLVSEGSRPRLPWGLQLKALIADPSPTLVLLEALQDDPSEYVRRSVANHLNDIAKDHPALVVEWVRRHLSGASAQRRALLAHASRTLIKRGHAPMLQIWGVGRAFAGSATLALTPRRLRIGESLTLEVRLQAGGRAAQPVVIDYAVHHRRSDGGHSPKVFKGWSFTLAPGESRTLTRRHSMRPVTTRRYHPGVHEIDLRINGREVARARFTLLAA